MVPHNSNFQTKVMVEMVVVMLQMMMMMMMICIRKYILYIYNDIRVYKLREIVFYIVAFIHCVCIYIYIISEV